MTPTQTLEDQLSGPIDDAVREAYIALAKAPLPDGMQARPTSHGFIARELRFEKDGHWLCSAVLNQGWILWYFRRPAFREGLIDFEATKARFEGIKDSGTGELKLRIMGPDLARDVLAWIAAA